MTWLLVVWPASAAGLMPFALPFPLPLHASLIILPLLLVLVVDRYLTRRPILTVPSFGLLAATSASIELFGSLTQIGIAIASSFAAVQPDPSWSFLNSAGRPDILLFVMLLILFVNMTTTGRECLRRDRKAHLTIVPIKILLIYSLARFYVGLACPLGQTDPTRTIVGLSLALLFGALAAIGRQRLSSRSQPSHEPTLPIPRLRP